MIARIKDVAEKAGVSVATVSRALGGGPVSETLRQRVEDAVAATGYRPNLSARRLRTRHTRTSDAAWSAGHAAALPRVRWSVPVAVCAVVAAIVLLVLGRPEWGIVAGLVGVLLQVAVLVSAVGPANRAARRAAQKSAPEPRA